MIRVSKAFLTILSDLEAMKQEIKTSDCIKTKTKHIASSVINQTRHYKEHL